MKLEDIIEYPYTAFHDGRDLPDIEFEQNAERIIKGVASDPRWSYQAGMEWNDARFNSYAEQIVEAVSSELLWSYEAGYRWKDERFNKYADRFVSRVAQDADMSYKAGRDWNDDRFYCFSDELIAAVQKDEETVSRALEHWDECRVVAISYPYLSPTIRRLQPEYKMIFAEFTTNIGGEQMQKMPLADFYNAAEAYEFAKQSKYKEMFFDNLVTCIEKGTVGKWAKHIIQYFRSNAKGAGNYRMLDKVLGEAA